MEQNSRKYKKKIRLSEAGCTMRGYLEKMHLHTVCSSARCPNQEECFGRGVATFMILGETCTRGCRFCAVATGIPSAIDTEEPARIAQVVIEKKLQHVVITSVTRDDLPHGGAEQFAAVIHAIRTRAPGVTIEVLTPDFKGEREALQIVIDAHPEVFNHNIETVPSLYATVRPDAAYQRSLDVLAAAQTFSHQVIIKSGIMLGLGETMPELDTLFTDLAHVGCRILTIGQYFQPDRSRVPVVRYYDDDAFNTIKIRAQKCGLEKVIAGRFVRSSYKAGEVYQELLNTVTNT